MNPILGVIFTRRCSFELHGDFEFCFVRRSHTNFLAERILVAVFLEASFASNTSWTSERKEKLQKYPHNSTPCPCQAIVCSQRSKRASFSLSRRLTCYQLSILILPYLHFDNIVSTALARSRHKKGYHIRFFGLDPNEVPAEYISPSLEGKYSVHGSWRRGAPCFGGLCRYICRCNTDREPGNE